MKTVFKLSPIVLSVSVLLLAGCGGDATTNIVERDPVVTKPDNDSGGGSKDIVIDSKGRLAVMSADSMTLTMLNIDNNKVLDSFSMTHEGSRLKASGGYRYAVISSRNHDLVEFIDGGLWREDHSDHKHDFAQNPIKSSFTLTGSRPTHIDGHEGKLAVFFDGNADAGTAAAVQVISDENVAEKSSTIPTLSYNTNMHGVAKPLDDFLVSTVRRDDAQSTSSAKILPDQVGIFHKHGNEYEREQLLDQTCPNLHGAGLSEEYVVFGCSDGVLVTHKHGNKFEAKKIANTQELDGIRIGSVYGHAHSKLFIGVARSRATGAVVVTTINPKKDEIEVLDWKPVEQAKPIAYSFSYDGAHLMILDDKGHLTALEAHEHNGETHMEFKSRLEVSNQDLTKMPENTNFRMAMSQRDDHVYVSDPIAKHVLKVDIEKMKVVGDIEVDFVPNAMVWLGVAKEGKHKH